MESSTQKKTRSRSKTSNTESAPATTEPSEIDMAPNLNGNKDGGKEKEDAPELEKVDLKVEPEETAPKVGTRKRKASEMKTDDAPTDESNKKEAKDEKPAEKEDTVSKDSKDDETETTKEVIDHESSDLPMDVSLIKPEVTDDSSAYESASEIKDISLSDINNKQSLGKGRRARVPNKRYSDISFSKNIDEKPLSIPKSPKSKSSENGLIEDIKIEAEPDIKVFLSSPAPTPTRKLKSAVDLGNPNFLKPFKYGWKRELVYRATSDNSLKRNGDIYYYTPVGKKVRSMREVAEHLKNKELSIDDFTFFKEPLGLDDPEKEIIRDAKIKYSGSTPASKKMLTPKVKSARVAASVKTPTPAVVDPPTSTPKSTKSPRVTGGFKVKLPKAGATKNKDKKSKEKDKDKDKDDEMEIGTYPPNWSSPPKKGKPNLSLTTVDHKPCRPCSIRCEGVLGLIPTLQCRVCLCLYHNECVGIAPLVNVQAYVCKNCQMEQDPKSSDAASVVLPPLTPANPQPSSSILPSAARVDQPPPVITKPPPINPPTEMPKLIPKPSILATIPKYVKISDSGPPQFENKSNLLGAVTTWFPASSSIQIGNTEITSNKIVSPEPPRPQCVEFIGNKKYLIVPRHNILSVSPNPNKPYNPRYNTLLAEKFGEARPSGGDTAKTELIKSPPNNTVADENDDEKMDIDPESPLPLNPPNDALGHLIGAGDDPQPPTTTTTTANDERSTLQQPTPPSPPKIAKITPKPTKTVAVVSDKESSRQESSKFMETYLQNLAYGYKTLLCVFQYLKVQDLLRAGCVCTMWRDVARHPLLWNTVRMKNSQIHRFEGLANALQKHGTVHLDLRKMLLPTNASDDIWSSFTSTIKKVDSLRKIELCRCLASVVEELATNNHNLESINAVTIKCESMSFEPFANLTNLTDLRLKSTAGLNLKSDLSALKLLTKLKHLSITSIKDLNKLNIDVIGELVNLEVLDIGECTDFPRNFGPEILRNLTKLEKLRLEKGQGECYTFDILEAVKDLPSMHQLELVNFDIKAGFDKSLGACLNIKNLLIIPTYISQSATTNHMVLGGVLKLQKTLSHFVWGVTLELLRVTELFVDQCEQPDKKEVNKDKNINTGDSIPVLKPVPLHGIPAPEGPPNSDPPQVEILPLPNLQKLLLQNLPTTRVKILKIPFHATWRQSITDSVN